MFIMESDICFYRVFAFSIEALNEKREHLIRASCFSSICSIVYEYFTKYSMNNLKYKKKESWFTDGDVQYCKCHYSEQHTKKEQVIKLTLEEIIDE